MALDLGPFGEGRLLPSPDQLVLGVCGNAVTHRGGKWYTHHSFGRIVDFLAARVRQIRYHAPQTTSSVTGACDYPFTRDNVVVHPWPAQRNSLQALKRPDRLLRQYWNMAWSCDALLLRGSLPLLWSVHWMAWLGGKPLVHWIVGNPVEVMKGERRGYGRLLRAAGIQFARFERTMTRAANCVAKTRVLTNGAELARIFRSPRTVEVVSTSITNEDFLVRDDTCRGKSIRLLFVGFVRPEKGLEYAIRALPAIEASTPVRLAIVGSWDQFSQERDRLAGISRELGLEDRVSWEGYAAFGRDLFDRMDRSDILVLPSLSEGTPRVLVEARARSLPIVSTSVGGIPSSISDGRDGLLVPPRDSAALAAAISRLIRDGDLRRRLINTGRENVRVLTVERFVELILALLTSRESTPGAAAEPIDLTAGGQSRRKSRPYHGRYVVH